MKKFDTVKADHPISQLSNTLSGMAFELAGKMRMSKMDVCAALANACGQILADASKPASGGKSLPRDEATKRMDDLRKVMEGAYDLRTVQGES